MVLTLLQDIVKLMFEMTNASECHRDAVFVCGGDRFVVFDRPAETGDWCRACDLRFSVTRHRCIGECLKDSAIEWQIARLTLVLLCSSLSQRKREYPVAGPTGRGSNSFPTATAMMDRHSFARRKRSLARRLFRRRECALPGLSLNAACPR